MGPDRRVAVLAAPDQTERPEVSLILAGAALMLLESYESARERLDEVAEDDYIEFVTYQDNEGQTEPMIRRESYRRTAISGYAEITDEMWAKREEALARLKEMQTEQRARQGGLQVPGPML